LPRCRERRVGVRHAGPSGRGEVSGRRNTCAVGQVRRDPRRVAGRVVYNAQREVVAVDKRDVVKRLFAAHTSDPVELGKRRGNLALTDVSKRHTEDAAGEAYRGFAAQLAEAVARPAGRTVPVDTVEVARPAAVLVERVVRPSPYPTLPVRAHIHLL